MSVRVRNQNKPLKFTWKLQKLTSCIYSFGQSIESSQFVVESLGPISWCLVFYPRGYRNPNYVACFLKRCGGFHNQELTVDLKMFLKTETRKENFLKTQSNLKFKDGFSLGFPEFVTREELERSYSNGLLTLKCYVSISNQASYISELLSLSNDLKLLYENETFYDVLVYVSKSVFKIHKAILHARATGLVRLIKESTQEDSIPSINISDFSPIIVKEAFYFMYTGNLTKNRFFHIKLRAFALEYNVDSLLIELTKSNFDDYMVSTEINSLSLSHRLHLFDLMANLGHKTMVLSLPGFIRSGKLIMQYFVLESDDGDIIVNVEISKNSKNRENYFLSLKFNGSLMCGNRILAEFEYETVINCAEDISIRFSHAFQAPLNTEKTMLCNLNLSDTPNSTRSIPSVPDTLACFSHDLSSLYSSSTDTDLALVTEADDVVFPVHKAIVCARVPTIMNMFKGDTQAVNGYVYDDLKNLEVTIPEMDSAMFENILKFIYSGKIEKSSMNEILKLKPDLIPIYLESLQNGYFKQLKCNHR